MILEDIEDEGSCYSINILAKKGKTNIARRFDLAGAYYGTVKTYLDLRSKDSKTPNVFIKYQNGKCSRQNILIDTLGAMPKEIVSSVLIS